MKKYISSYKVISHFPSPCARMRPELGPDLCWWCGVESAGSSSSAATNNFTQVRGPLAYWH